MKEETASTATTTEDKIYEFVSNIFYFLAQCDWVNEIGPIWSYLQLE